MKCLIIGGAGFIGCNIADRMMSLDHEVVIVDNLSRLGSDKNLEWLKTKRNFTFEQIDIRNFDKVCRVIRKHGPDVIIHEAAQVTVTSSILNPREDFEVNALGTFNLLEATRRYAPSAIFLFASTNKVYGKLGQLDICEVDGRYQFKDLTRGINENFPLDFHTPYGCSKGVADQYVRDYARVYGLRTVVFRQSCIYGPRQFGIEDQGWVAWFTIAALTGETITIYGDGKQVRDILYIEDLIQICLRAIQNIDVAAGQIYNIGGGPDNQMSLLNLLDKLRVLTNKDLHVEFCNWRLGDQRIYVSDVHKAKSELSWVPETDNDKGLRSLFNWVSKNLELVKFILTQAKNE